MNKEKATEKTSETKPLIAVVGADGMLGNTLVKVLEENDFATSAITIEMVDIRDAEAIDAIISGVAPVAVVNCAAYTDVDACETNEEMAFAVNGAGAGNVAATASSCGAAILHISTDYVFNGKSETPYVETDEVDPVGVYARSKLEGEIAVARENANYVIVRTAWLYGAGGKNFVDTIAALAADREELRVVADQFGSPTYTVDLARAIARILKLSISNNEWSNAVYHLTGSGTCNWHEFAEEIVRLRPGKVKAVIPVTTDEFPRPAPRPHYSILDNSRAKADFDVELPHWKDALAEYLLLMSRQGKN